MSKYTIEERNALWASGEYVSLEGKPLTGIFRDRARIYHWSVKYPDRAMSQSAVEGNWLEGNFIDRWQRPLAGAARTAAEKRVLAIRREQQQWRLHGTARRLDDAATEK